MAKTTAEDILRALFSEEPLFEEEAPEEISQPPALPKEALKPERVQPSLPKKSVQPVQQKKKKPRSLRKMMIAHEIFSLPVSLRRP